MGPNAVIEGLSKIGREAARIVLPAACIVCEQELPWRDRVASCCRSCWASLPAMSGMICRICGASWSGESEEAEFTCISCIGDPWELDSVRSWGHYRGSLERVLHAFKFERHDFLARPLGGLLTECLESSLAGFDLIVPVPMSRKKERRRGYNQAELLARAIAEKSGLPRGRDLLQCACEHATQSSLPRAERRQNVRDAFKAMQGVRDRSILLVDDICTTGETLRACARALLRAGAGRVSAVTVARA